MKINKEYRSLGRQKQVEIWEKIIGKKKHEYIRDFLITEGSVFKRNNSKTIIMHVPSGLWSGFNISYDKSILELKNNPQNDNELMQVIYTV